MSPKHVLIGVGRYASQQSYYRLSPELAAQVLPTGYYGWPDGNRADVITDSETIKLKSMHAPILTDIKEAKRLIRDDHD
jgi:hypothetical protein